MTAYNVTEEKISIPSGFTRDIDCSLFYPDKGVPESTKTFPGVLFMPDIGGIRPANRSQAKRIAGEGYVVLLPNVFFRDRPTPLLDFDFSVRDERFMKRVGELRQALPDRMQGDDTVIYLDYLEKLPNVKKGKMGTVGYCYTGAMSLRAAAASPDRVGVAASFHGGGLCTDAPDSPHLLLPKIKARIYAGHATDDKGMSVEAIEKFDLALKAWSEKSGGVYKSDVYKAHHGWTVPDSPEYNAAEGDHAFNNLIRVLGETL